MIWQFIVNAAASGSVYALVALGFSVIYSTTRLFHFAHGAVYTLAAYAFYVFWTHCALPATAAFGLAVLLSAGVGVFLEWAVYAPLARNGVSTLVGMISSIGVYIVLVNLVALVFGNSTIILQPGVAPTYTIGPATATSAQIAEVASFLVVYPLVAALLRYTAIGKMIRGARDNDVLLTLLGINAQGVRYIVFALGSGLAATAGILAALDVGVEPNVGMTALLGGAVAVIIGGIGVFEGAAVGGFLLAALQGIAVWKMSDRWQAAVTFSLLVLFLVFRPEGLLGVRRRLEEAG